MSSGGGLGVLVGVAGAWWFVLSPEAYVESGLYWLALRATLRWALWGLVIGCVAGALSRLLSLPPATGALRWAWSAAGALGGLVLVTASATYLLRPRPEGPNLLLLSIDTLRADRLGCYGYPKAQTPNLDALAREGVLWETVVASAPVTLTAMSTVMTGLDPPQHRAHYNGFYELRRDAVTLAEILADRGYTTGAVVGNFALDSRFRIDQGFLTFDDVMTQLMTPAAAPPEPPKTGNWWTRHTMTRPAQRHADEVTAAGLEWLQTRPDQPFFLWLHYMDPHGPYLPPPEFLEHDPYDGEVAFVDAEIGKLLAGHDELFPDADTLVVVVADHGESLGEHGVTGHVFAVYDEMLRVPFLMRRRGVLEEGRRVTTPLRGKDVKSRILEALDAEPALLGGGPEEDDWWAYSETYHPLIAERGLPIRSLRGVRWKLVYQEDGTRALYDLRDDPRELRNLFARRPEEVSRLRAILDRIAGSTRVGTVGVDDETLERLRAMGYVE